MEQIVPQSNGRLKYFCVYCGDAADTREHVPPRVFLDEPYPENLPVVPACKRCNEGFSDDEAYMACVIECALAGTTDPNILKRDKVKRILSETPLLRKRIDEQIIKKGSDTYFSIEIERFKNIIIKLAKGHIMHENSECPLTDPTRVLMIPIIEMSEEALKEFEQPDSFSFQSLLPEVGSRSLFRWAANNLNYSWINVQSGNYSYLFSCNNGLRVRMIIRDYLACEVYWDDF
ncbi:MAG: hypothetical protein HPY53_00815 [Brevinematales bacterium]|nr:hypothetical protein [Brevinematales bacterium]